MQFPRSEALNQLGLSAMLQSKKSDNNDVSFAMNVKRYSSEFRKIDQRKSRSLEGGRN